jgi:hypothetical protein
MGAVAKKKRLTRYQRDFTKWTPWQRHMRVAAFAGRPTVGMEALGLSHEHTAVGVEIRPLVHHKRLTTSHRNGNPEGTDALARQLRGSERENRAISTC